MGQFVAHNCLLIRTTINYFPVVEYEGVVGWEKDVVDMGDEEHGFVFGPGTQVGNQFHLCGMVLTGEKFVE